MKLPRWLVIGMLTTSVLSVLAAAGWWWVTWPERTAREFVLLIVDQNWDEAIEMTPMKAAVPDFSSLGEPGLVRSTRSWVDICCGRRRFELRGEKQTISFTVENGRISELVFWTDIRDKLPAF